MSNPLDRWEASIKAGKATEAAIAITFYTHLGMVCEDNTRERVKNPDLKGSCTLDAKLALSPYPSSPTPAGLTSAEHVTLDQSNLADYPADTTIWVVVDYTAAGIQTKGLYYIKAGVAREIIKNNPKRCYSRSSRTAKDKVAKCAISTREMGRHAFPGMTLSETADEVLRAQKHPLASLMQLADID